MEASTLKHAGHAGIHGRSPLLRLQTDERLVALTRRGNHGAFEALVSRYQARLLAFCRHMLSSREDAEDVLQEVFAAAYNAMLADTRAINVRPWLYRIARNRSLNHLRKAQAIGVDSMDVHLSEHGLTTADKVHKREEFLLLMGDVRTLPETQRTALLLREIDALSYEQIAEAMETTVPSVKSLLVRARVSLAEAAEARLLSCEDVRDELGEVAEGLRRTTAPVRRHLRGCERCQLFRKQLRCTNRALAAVLPVGPLLLLKKSLLAHLGSTAAASGGSAAAGAAGAAAGGALGAGAGALASKAAAGLAAAAIVTAGAVEVGNVTHKPSRPAARPAPSTAVRSAEPVPVASAPQPASDPVPTEQPAAAPRPVREAERRSAPASVDPAPPAVASPPQATPVPTPPAPNVEQHEGDTTTLPTDTTAQIGPGDGSVPRTATSHPNVAPPVDGSTATPPPPPSPAATPEPTPVTPVEEPAPEPQPAPEPTPDSGQQVVSGSAPPAEPPDRAPAE